MTIRLRRENPTVLSRVNRRRRRRLGTRLRIPARMRKTGDPAHRHPALPLRPELHPGLPRKLLLHPPLLLLRLRLAGLPAKVLVDRRAEISVIFRVRDSAKAPPCWAANVSRRRQRCWANASRHPCGAAIGREAILTRGISGQLYVYELIRERERAGSIESRLSESRF